MKIEKDNLTPKQKKNVYLIILLLGIIICAFFFYKNYDNENREKLLSKNFEFTYCRIIGSNTYKSKTNFLEYNVDGIKYETRPLSSRIFNIGEFYSIKYSKSNPEISEVDYTKPIILNKNDFDFTNGIVTKTFEKESLSVLSFSYNYQNENYEREIILEKIGELKKGKQIEILVNKKNPEISYLTEQIKAE
jgi:hypothetical protein